MTDDLSILRDLLRERFDVERELGGGGMSRVYLAVERDLGRKVVIKVLAPELGQLVNVDRFQQEIATSATLQHPQIVPVYFASAAGDIRYYVMPFVAGESLRAHLVREGRLPSRVVIRLLAPLARALAYAHRQGVIHRDVKPENILLAEGEPMLADFGIAKVIREGGSSSGLTSAGMSIGTVTYMPPEQVAADPNIDGKADVYSLAAVGYELLSGAPPFTGTPSQVMSAHVLQPVPALTAPDVPPTLAEAIMLGLSKDPAARPDAEQFATLLDASRTGDVVTPSTAARRVMRPLPVRRWAIGGIVALAVIVLAVIKAKGSDGTVETKEPTVAVLPFETIGSDDDAYLAAGVTEEVMTGLAQLPDLRVLSRSTVRAYADSNFGPADYLARLHVRALIEGSIQRAGDQLRVSVRLIDTRDGSAMWSNRYEKAMSDVFATQREISAGITAALQAELALVAGTAHPEYAADAEAYDLFLRGRYALRERGEQGLRTALSHFAAAASLDPKFARAHAGIAEAAALLPIYADVSRESVSDTIRASAARAIALDTALAAPHVALGLLEKGLGRWTEGERELVSALRLDPAEASAHQNLGELYFAIGRIDDARQSLERAARLEPTVETIVAEFAYALLLAGATDSAVRTISRVAAAPGNPFVSYTQSMLAEASGDRAGMVRHARAAAAAAPLPFFVGSLARALVLTGDTVGARAALAATQASAPGVTFGAAIAGLPSDPADVIFPRLFQAVKERDPFVVMLPLRGWWYDRLRADPRFAQFADSLHLPPAARTPLPSATR